MEWCSQTSRPSDFLPLVTRVAESSPLLENFSLAASRLPDYYKHNQLGTVSGTLQTAVARMTKLTRLAIRNDMAPLDRCLVDILLSGDGTLVQRLQRLEVGLSSEVLLNLVLARCLNLRDLTLHQSDLAELEAWANGEWPTFEGGCSLRQLISFSFFGQRINLYFRSST